MIKIFAHRGFVDGDIKENSFASLVSAYKNNFCGIEFDVWLVNSELVVNHDEPTNSNYTKFSEYLYFKNDLEYWIDFKNLNNETIDNILDLLQDAVLQAKIDINKIFFAPFITDLKYAIPLYQKIRNYFADAKIMAVCEKIEKNELSSYCEDLQKNNIKYLSINYTNIDSDFMNIFRNITIFAWTVNEEKILKYLSDLGVKNFASDKNFNNEYNKNLIRK